MQAHLNGLEEELDLYTRYLRPGAIFLGLGVLLLGAIVLGASLTVSQPPRMYVYSGPILVLLGVSLVGGGLVMEPSEYWLDPEIEFVGWQRNFVAGISVAFLLFAGLVALFGG